MEKCECSLDPLLFNLDPHFQMHGTARSSYQFQLFVCLTEENLSPNSCSYHIVTSVRFTLTRNFFLIGGQPTLI